MALRRVRRKQPKKGYCRACGSKLTKQESIDRGFGDKCFENNCMILLDIRPDGKIIITKRVIEPMSWVVE